jgi:hypothetical protein
MSPVSGSGAAQTIAATESTIEVFEPTIETIVRTIEVFELPIETIVPTINVSRPTIEVLGLRIDVCEPTIERIEPTIEAIERTIEALEPAIERIGPRKSTPASIGSIVDSRRSALDLAETLSKPETSIFESVTNTLGLIMSIVDLITSALGSIPSSLHPNKGVVGSRRALPEVAEA